MAGTTSAQIKNLRDSHNQSKDSHFLKGSSTELSGDKKGKQFTSFELMKKTQRLETYSKYWSILSNVAALVSIAAATYTLTQKRSRWL